MPLTKIGIEKTSTLMVDVFVLSAFVLCYLMRSVLFYKFDIYIYMLRLYARMRICIYTNVSIFGFFFLFTSVAISLLHSFFLSFFVLILCPVGIGKIQQSHIHRYGHIFECAICVIHYIML